MNIIANENDFVQMLQNLFPPNGGNIMLPDGRNIFLPNNKNIFLENSGLEMCVPDNHNIQIIQLKISDNVILLQTDDGFVWLLGSSAIIKGARSHFYSPVFCHVKLDSDEMIDVFHVYNDQMYFVTTCHKLYSYDNSTTKIKFIPIVENIKNVKIVSNILIYQKDDDYYACTKNSDSIYLGDSGIKYHKKIIKSNENDVIKIKDDCILIIGEMINVFILFQDIFFIHSVPINVLEEDIYVYEQYLWYKLENSIYQSDLNVINQFVVDCNFGTDIILSKKSLSIFQILEDMIIFTDSQESRDEETQNENQIIFDYFHPGFLDIIHVYKTDKILHFIVKNQMENFITYDENSGIFVNVNRCDQYYIGEKHLFYTINGEFFIFTSANLGIDINVSLVDSYVYKQISYGVLKCHFGHHIDNFIMNGLLMLYSYNNKWYYINFINKNSIKNFYTGKGHSIKFTSPDTLNRCLIKYSDTLKKSTNIVLKHDFNPNFFIEDVLKIVNRDSKISTVTLETGDDKATGEGVLRHIFEKIVKTFRDKFLKTYSKYITKFIITDDLIENATTYGMMLHMIICKGKTNLPANVPLVFVEKLLNRKLTISEMEYFISKDETMNYSEIFENKNNLEYLESISFDSYEECLREMLEYPVDGIQHTIANEIAKGFLKYSPINNIDLMNAQTLYNYLSGNFKHDREKLHSQIVFKDLDTDKIDMIRSVIDSLSESEFETLLTNWTSSSCIIKHNYYIVGKKLENVIIKYDTCFFNLEINPDAFINIDYLKSVIIDKVNILID